VTTLVTTPGHAPADPLAPRPRRADPKSAVAVLELVALAYPQSADAHETLAEAYLDDKQPERARAEAAKTLELLGKRDLPASTWSDTPERRGEIRHGAEDVLRKLGPAGRLP